MMIKEIVRRRILGGWCIRDILAYQIKDDMALVCEVLYYECTNYDWDQEEEVDPFFIIEYKLLPSNRKDEYRYVSEQNLRKVEND